MVSWVFLAVGCLERVTGEDVPLDPRFYEGRASGDGQPTDPHGDDPSQPEGSVSGGGEGPYAGFEGETFVLKGVVRGEELIPVQIDVNEPDDAAPGGARRAGAIRLDAPGPFEVKVPKSVKALRFQAFQDPTADGPDESDPFAEAAVELADGPPADFVLQLVKGARGLASGGGGGAPGSPGGGGAPGSPGGPPTAAQPNEGLTFPAGPSVNLTGTVVVSRDIPVILDFFRADGAGAGGRSYLGKRVVDAGAWAQAFPENYGAVEVEAYQDLTGDSRTGDDPSARTQRAIQIVESDADAGTLTIP
ncbi:MAG: hypothetical protein Q8P18_04285 [Pseudomonadota bacterium]|nr:hypothetical protein [Pseudomonadota bacterium]